MNRSMMVGLVAGGIAATALGALATHQLIENRQSYAQVTSVESVTKTVRTPRQVCNDVAVTHQAPTQDPKRVTGAVVGAVIGGALGNQFGHGSGKTAATVAGAAAGGYAGSKVQKNIQEGNTYTTNEARCSTVYDTSEKANGYKVTYQLDGRTGTVHMDHDPGRRIPVKDGELVLVAAQDSAD